ncbi:SLOG family protein [Clostridium sp.]|uniref:SLOG family protein n=1 Tax=Clostridium sp. TaxID=1506 RepID=UPI001B4D5152|nr:SLOG family protein [Clostridium sp.]MBP3914464.1 DUF2493 domain-containing protein [Clostridium sp.]
MKIIISGSKLFDDYKLFSNKFIKILKDIESDVADKKIGLSDIEIFTGCSKGTDKLARQFAENNNIQLKVFHAEWNILGKAAGDVRNEKMISHAINSNDNSVLVVFWDGMCKDSEKFIKLGHKNNIKVYTENVSSNINI